MPIDTSIYGNLRQFEAPDALGTAQKAMSLSHLGMQQRQAMDAQRDQDAMKSAYAGSVGPDGQIDQKRMLSSLASSAPHLMPQVQSQFAEQAQKLADSKQKTLADHLNQVNASAQLLSSAKDDASYRAAMEQGKQLGLDVSTFPQDYASAKPMIDRTLHLTLDAKQRLENMVKSQEMDLAAQKAPLERGEISARTRHFDAETANLNNNQKLAGAKAAGDLREERSKLPVSKATQEVSAAYNKIQNAAKNPSAAGDLSLIFGYMKILDPGSTVREGEFANAQNASGIPTQVMNIYNKIRTGERLAPEQREDFITQAGGLYQAQMSQQRKIDGTFSRMAKERGMNPDDVLLNFDADTPDSGPHMTYVDWKDTKAGGQKPQAGGLPGVTEAQAGQGASPMPRVGAVVAVGGKHYTVGPDGDTLIPVAGKSK